MSNKNKVPEFTKLQWPVVNSEQARAAWEVARKELMTTCGPDLVADLLIGIGKHVQQIGYLDESEYTDNSNEPPTLIESLRLVRPNEPIENLEMQAKTIELDMAERSEQDPDKKRKLKIECQEAYRVWYRKIGRI